MTTKSAAFASLVRASLAALLLAGSALAQGADDCGSAQPIAGLGLFAFDNTAATPDGPSDCAGLPVRKDVWFRWTAPATDHYKLTLCGLTSLATRIAVYDGINCASLNLIACDTSGCTLQSYVNFSAIVGQQYLFRIGSRQVGVGGSGQFEVKLDPCPGAGDDAFEQNDVCTQPTPIGDGTYNNLFVSKTDDDWYMIEVPDQAQVTIDVLFSHATGDLDIFLYEICGGPQVAVSGSASDNEQIVHTNMTGCLQKYKLHVDHWLPDASSDCNTYSMVIAGSGSGGPTCDLGTNFCSSTPNSTGFPAVMDASGTKSVAANNLVLEAGPVPNQPGIFFYSAGTAGMGSGVPFGNGLRCVGNGQNPLYRLGIVAASSNFMSYLVDNTQPPAAGGTILPGSTFYFQAWFRDPAGGGAAFDLSDGYQIDFVP